MSTFGTMVERIIREVARSGITADTKAAIHDSIQFYKNERFHFNFGSVDVSVSSGAEQYSFSAEFLEVERLQFSATGVQQFSMNKDDQVPANDIFDSQMAGRASGGTANPAQPTAFALYGDQLLFDTQLDRAYNLGIKFHKDLTDVSASAEDTATNAWVTDAELMIREKAKSFLYHGRLKGPAQALQHEAWAEAARIRLKGRVFTTDKIKPTQF